MKIAEVREKTAKLDEEQLRKLICELYKAIPKATREEREIDLLFEPAQESDKKQKEARVQKIDMLALSAEIEEFLSNAYDQLYFAPNRIIPKKERPKWRFKVRNYVKILTQVTPATPEGKTSADLLARLYRMTAYACSYYLFNTEDAFASVMIEQPDFYGAVVHQYLKGDRGRETFRILVNLLAPEGISRTNLYSDMYPVLLKAVHPDEYEMLLETALEVQKEKLNKLKGTSSYDNYYKQEEANHITEFISTLYLAMNDTDNCVKNLFDNDQERDSSVTLYKLLFRYINAEKDPEEWIRQYKAALAKGVKDRSDIHRRYEEVLKEIEERE